MGKGRFKSLLSAALLAVTFGQPPLFAQHEHEHEMHNTAPGLLRYDIGSIEHGRYSNQCLGFTYVMPAGWDISMIVGRDGRAKHSADGGLSLLAIQQHTDMPPSNMLVLTARAAPGQAQSTEEFVKNAVHSQINARAAGRELIRDTYAVEYGGRKFFRSDSKQAFSNGVTSYMSVLATKFRGYYIGANLVTGSPEALDRAADSLERMTFSEDEPNPACVAGDGTSPVSTEKPLRVRVSPRIADLHLEKQVQASYPEEARRRRVQGEVVLKVVISTTGEVSEVSLLRGDPLLAPTAMDAVKQWKYKPYLLNGQPVEMEAQVTVPFTLQGAP